MSIRNKIIILLTIIYAFGCCSDKKACNCDAEKETIEQVVSPKRSFRQPEDRTKIDEELNALKKVLKEELCEKLPHSLFGAISYRDLSFDELYQLNCWQLKVLRNVPYASHGMKFQEFDLSLFFDHCTPMGRAPAIPHHQAVSKISPMEWRNIERIQQVEEYYQCTPETIFQ